MFYIKEGEINDINYSEIIVKDFSYLMNNDEYIIRKLIEEDKNIQTINFSKRIIDKTIDTIIHDREISELYEELIKIGLPLFSLFPVTKYQKNYEQLKKFRSAKYIIIECNKNNLIKGLDLAKRLNKNIIINGSSISLTNYEKILSNYDLNSLDNINIKINYQSQNSAISIKELYDLAIKINNISQEIEKYNLSELEKIIYVYDIVKSREYKKSTKSKAHSRDLNKIIDEDTIVCVGYSNLFNAILKNLNINAAPLISTKEKHQRSLVYIKDDKYALEGVYVFDPTWDRKTKKEFIDNYKYFGITLNDSEKDIECDIFSSINISFNEVIRRFNSKDGEIIYEITSKVKKIFEFIKDKNYDEFKNLIETYTFLSTNMKEITKEIYLNVISKYKPKHIAASVFFEALYNTRLIEYYNGIINKIDIQDLSEVVIDKYISQNISYSDKKEEINRFIETLNYDINVRSVLNKQISQNRELIKRKHSNIRLLKLLRNREK